MTSDGGDSGYGTIFSISTNGSGFTLLHEFAGGAAGGSSSHGSLTLSGSTFYGMTRQGGDSDDGTIFSIGVDGSNFTLLHEFTGADEEGHLPSGDVILSGSTLYGMTSFTGGVALGTIFSIGTDGSGFTLLHEFVGSPDDGSYPSGSLTLSGSTLYGMTYGGGDDHGTIFSIGTDGSGFALLHEFGFNDGAEPQGSLVLNGSTLYGMTSYGGDPGWGTVFSVVVPEPSTWLLMGIGLLAFLTYASRWRGLR